MLLLASNELLGLSSNLIMPVTSASVFAFGA